jgi:hypothetical protein
MVDRPVDFDEFICSFATVKGFHGHLNWFVTTFTGALSFGDHNFDDDYYLALGTDLNNDRKPDGLACITGDGNRDTLHTQFNADRTRRSRILRLAGGSLFEMLSMRAMQQTPRSSGAKTTPMRRGAPSMPQQSPVSKRRYSSRRRC